MRGLDAFMSCKRLLDENYSSLQCLFSGLVFGLPVFYLLFSINGHALGAMDDGEEELQKI